MAVKQNAIDFGKQYPQVARVVHQSFYEDDGLTRGDTIQEVAELQRQLRELFAQGGFMLRKWKTSIPAALKHVSTHLLDEQSTHEIVGTGLFSTNDWLYVTSRNAHKTNISPHNCMVSATLQNWCMQEQRI